MNDTVTIRRIDFKTYELSLNGTAVILKKGDFIKTIPNCFNLIDKLFPAAKAACCCLIERDFKVL
jgi:hypothetical protein